MHSNNSYSPNTEKRKPSFSKRTISKTTPCRTKFQEWEPENDMEQGLARIFSADTLLETNEMIVQKIAEFTAKHQLPSDMARNMCHIFVQVRNIIEEKQRYYKQANPNAIRDEEWNIRIIPAEKRISDEMQFQLTYARKLILDVLDKKTKWSEHDDSSSEEENIPTPKQTAKMTTIKKTGRPRKY